MYSSPSAIAAVEIVRRILSKCHDPSAGGDVAALGGVDGVKVADAFAVLGVLAVGDVHAILEDHRRGNQLVARPRPDRILRVGVELPELLARLRLVPAHPAVALRGDDLA